MGILIVAFVVVLIIGVLDTLFLIVSIVQCFQEGFLKHRNYELVAVTATIMIGCIVACFFIGPAIYPYSTVALCAHHHVQVSTLGNIWLILFTLDLLVFSYSIFALFAPFFWGNKRKGVLISLLVLSLVALIILAHMVAPYSSLAC